MHKNACAIHCEWTSWPCFVSKQDVPFPDLPGALLKTRLAVQSGFCRIALQEQMPRHSSCSFFTLKLRRTSLSYICSCYNLVGFNICQMMVLPFKNWQNVNNIRFLFCVLTLERLPCSLYKFLNGIAGQVSSGMFSLTVGACVETPRMRDRHTMRHKRMYGHLIFSTQPAEMCKLYLLNDHLSRKAFKQASIWQLLWTHNPSANDLLINPMT